MEKEFNNHSTKLEKIVKTRRERVEELNGEIKELLRLKQEWRNKSKGIILNTDFKALYKKDNEHIRNAHLQNEIPDLYDKIEIQEEVVNYIKADIAQIDKEISMHHRIMKFVTLVNDKNSSL